MKTLLADTHVHFYDVYDPVRFLDAAISNLQTLGERSGSSSATFILCMVDLEGQDAMTRLQHASPSWTLTVDESGRASAVRAKDQAILHLLPGHQLVSKEGLEVLALDCRFPVPSERLPLTDLIQKILEEGGIPVLPWGVGKWTGARASLLQPYLGQPGKVIFADSGNRLVGSPVPPSLRYAVDHGRCPVAGSDPLPLASHELRPGSYATLWTLKEEESGSPSDLLRCCLNEPRSGTWVGELTPSLHFIKDQAIMQRNKRAPWLKWPSENKAR